MSNRVDYYFRQRVSESELDKGFNYLEQADWDFATDLDVVGVVVGLTVAQQGTPNMTAVLGLGTAYDALGKRVRVPSAQNVNLALDHAGATTAVVTAGNERWLSVFVGFQRALSDVRTDGNGLPVYFERAESFEVYVVRGAEAAIGAAARPALDAARVLLADVRLVEGQTTVVTANISTLRRQDAIVAAGSPRAISRGSVKGAVTDLLAYYNAHIAGADHHAAAHVDYAGGPAWLDGATNPAASVEAQLDKIVTDLVARAGAARVGAAALPALWDGTIIDQATLQLTLAYLVSTFNDQAGAEKIGAAARTAYFGAQTLDVGSIADQLQELLEHLADLRRVRPITANATLDDAGYEDGIVFVSTLGGPVTFQLRTAADCYGRRIVLVDAERNFNVNNLTIAPFGPEPINNFNVPWLVSTQDARVTLYSDGGRWFTSSTTR